MFMRISSFAAALAIVAAACTGPVEQTTNTQVLARVEANAQAQAEDDGRILCAIGGAPLTRSCTVDQMQEARGLVLTIRHPDGGFHRLLVTRDGRGVVAADGAEHAAVTVTGDKDIEVVLGTDRYRLPATIKRP